MLVLLLVVAVLLLLGSDAVGSPGSDEGVDAGGSDAGGDVGDDDERRQCTNICVQFVSLTLSLPRVMDVEFPLKPQHITQYEELGFS